MTNLEHYMAKHPESREDFKDEAMTNFRRHCAKFDHCKGCPKHTGDLSECFAAWLKEEYKGDEPMACPFCKSEVKVYKGGYKDSNGNTVLSYVKCVKCGYTSPCNTHENGHEEAIVEHNRLSSMVFNEGGLVREAYGLIALLMTKLEHYHKPTKDIEVKEMATMRESVAKFEEWANRYAQGGVVIDGVGHANNSATIEEDFTKSGEDAYSVAFMNKVKLVEDAIPLFRNCIASIIESNCNKGCEKNLACGKGNKVDCEKKDLLWSLAKWIEHATKVSDLEKTVEAFVRFNMGEGKYEPAAKRPPKD